MDDLAEQNRVLRERVAELEKALAAGADPILRSLSEHAASFINVIDLDGRFLATGRESEGFGSVIGRSVMDFVEPKYLPLMREVFARVAATGRPETYESVGYGEDGSAGHTYLTHVVPLRENGVVNAFVLVPTEITDRVALERSLMEQEQSLRLAVQASRMGMWRWDVASGVVAWDDRLCEIWGAERAPTNYAAYLAMVHHADRALVESVIKAALETGVYRTFEHRVAATDKNPERWVLAAGSVARNAEGKPLRLMGGALDITEQKQLAAQLERAERVESIGQLTAGIAHNFNNLLAAILPNVELALMAAADPQRAGLSAALDAALQARELIRNLMSLTQRGDPRSHAPADPRDVVARVEGICRVTFPREIALSHQVAANLGSVVMSVGNLEQVLLNLLFNARDAIEASGHAERTIDVAVDRMAEGPGAPHVRIRVKDSGIGMTNDVRARVFDPFFTTKPPHKGSGLGLANVAARIREAGGSISCESVPGVGSTFIVLLPSQAPSVPRPNATPATSVVKGGGAILLVDDEPLVRSVLRRLLERERFVVHEAGSAAEAREILQQRGIVVDLVILDQSMPRETGLQALPSIRELTEAPIVLFTGMAPDVPTEVAAVLEKPALPAELYRVVRDVLGRTSAR